VLTLKDKLTILQEENRTLKEKRSVLIEKVESLQKLLETKEENIDIELKDSKEEETTLVTSEKEELKMAKDKLEKEKSDLVAANEEILQKIQRQQRAREELEATMKKEQAKIGIGMDFIRKNLVEHLRDLSFWKEFLENEVDFKKESITLINEETIKSLSYEGQTTELSKAVAEENKRLEHLLENRQKYKLKLEEEKKKLEKFQSVQQSPVVSGKKKSAASKNRKSTGSVTDRIIHSSKKKS